MALQRPVDAHPVQPRRPVAARRWRLWGHPAVKAAAQPERGRQTRPRRSQALTTPETAERGLQMPEQPLVEQTLVKGLQG